MKYGHYLCSKCDKDYGKKVEDTYCCICGATLKYVENLYQD